MSIKKGKDKSSENWEKPGFTSTHTEIETSPDSVAQELLMQAQKSEPALIVVQGEAVGSVLRLQAGRNSIGRHPNCDVVIQQRAVSSQHAEIRVAESSVIFEDLKSTNGTTINRETVTRPVVLQAGDLIKIGNSVFKYVNNKLDASIAESLHQQTSTDSLTGVSNKGYLLKALTSSMDIAKTGYPLSIIIFDLDFFKKVNDTYGHIAGDYILKESCRVIKENVVRSDDVIGRFGGEEFMIIMPDSPLRVAAGVAERIRKTLETHPFEFSGQKIPVTASLGVATWRETYTKAEDFIEAVDKLLYVSKQAGRNRVTEEPAEALK